MADKEERILITKCSSHCHALRVSYDPFDGDDGMYCDKSGKWIRITEKDCAKCKNPVLAGITRADAVERMAKANWITVVCLKNKCTPESVSQKEWDSEWNKLSKPYKKVYFAGAEAALNALLEDNK